jgi:hypothetical protein
MAKLFSVWSTFISVDDEASGQPQSLFCAKRLVDKANAAKIITILFIVLIIWGRKVSFFFNFAALFTRELCKESGPY